MYLGCTVLTEEHVKGAKRKLRPKERLGEKYEVSRWTPLLQDIVEVYCYTFSLMDITVGIVCSQYAAADSLDDSYCPWLRNKPRPSSGVALGAMGSSSVTSGGGKDVISKKEGVNLLFLCAAQGVTGTR